MKKPFISAFEKATQAVRDDPSKEVWRYEGDTTEDGERHGFGKLISLVNESIRYEGEWYKGLRQGKGKQVFPTGETYQGYWKNDLMDGEGTVTYPSNDTFVGLWKEGKRVKGTLSLSGVKVKYYESWTDDAPGPFGTLELAEGGCLYYGEVSYAQLGKYQIKNYTVFRHGYGEMRWPTKRYIGGWKEDKRKGYGIYIDEEGEKYWGEWKSGKRSGYGIQMFHDGGYYEGAWHNNERKGKGKICAPNGDIIIGEWSNEKLNSGSYHKKPFDDVPKHIRELFIKSTCGSQTFPSDRYISPEKWNTLIKFSIDKINPNLTIDDIEVIFRENQRAQIMRTKFGTDPLFHLLENFCHMFKWDYSDWLNDMKNNICHFDLPYLMLQAGLAEVMPVKNSEIETKQIMKRILSKTICTKIFDTLFPLYQTQFKKEDHILLAKLRELRDITPQIIGIKSTYQLDSSKSPKQVVTHVRKPAEPPSKPKSRKIKKNLLTEADEKDFEQFAANYNLGTSTSTLKNEEVVDKKANRRSRVMDQNTSNGTYGSRGTLIIRATPSNTVTPRKQPSVQVRIQRSHTTQYLKQDEPLVHGQSTESFKSDQKKPFASVISHLESLYSSKDPHQKLSCLKFAIDAIGKTIEEFHKKKLDVKDEDKKIILMYCIIHSKSKHLWSEYMIIQDFLSVLHPTENDKANLNIFKIAIEQLRDLDSSVKTPEGTLISSKALSIKFVELLREELLSIQAERSDKIAILVMTRSIIKKLSNIKPIRSPSDKNNTAIHILQIVSDTPADNDLLSTYFSCFSRILGLPELGLKFEKTKTVGNSELYAIHFNHMYPLHVCANLANNLFDLDGISYKYSSCYS